MELNQLLIIFAQTVGMSYETAVNKANAIIFEAQNSFVQYGIKVDGGNSDERLENLIKELNKFKVS